jgi:hypothetical protein
VVIYLYRLRPAKDAETGEVDRAVKLILGAI